MTLLFVASQFGENAANGGSGLFGVNLTATRIVELELKNGFDDTHFQKLHQLASVQYLSLENTNGTDAGLLALARHPKLCLVKIGKGNLFTARAIAELRAKRPDLSVEFRPAP